MISLYVLTLGIIFASMGSVELTLRERAFRFWMRWFNHRLFFMHGAALIILGFPLTFYNGKWSAFVFIVGLVMVLTGPFILIYPEKIRNSFSEIGSEAGEESLRGLVVFDAAVRVVAGILFVYCTLA